MQTQEWKEYSPERRKGVVLIRGCFKYFISCFSLFPWFSWLLEILEFIVLKRGCCQNIVSWFPWFSCFPVQKRTAPFQHSNSESITEDAEEANLSPRAKRNEAAEEIDHISSALINARTEVEEWDAWYASHFPPERVLDEEPLGGTSGLPNDTTCATMM